MKKILILIFSILLIHNSWAGQWQALIVGVNHYDSIKTTLRGAENDLEAINNSLPLPKTQKTVLKGNAATYDAIKNWWEKAIAGAKKDDVIFFSFSGHGAKEAEHFSGTEAMGAAQDGATIYDEYDEVLVLPKYSNTGKNSRERIIDNELLAWAKRATDKGAYVFIVVDACYGGGGTRSASSGQNYDDPSAIARNGDLMILQPSEEIKRGTRAEAELRATDSEAFHSRLFYAIPYLDETQVVHEMNLGGKRHGTLSYLIAQALSGKATVDGKPVKTAFELNEYLKSQSGLLAGQSSRIIGINPKNRHFSLIPNKTSHESTTNKPAPSEPTKYTIYIENGDTKLENGGTLYALTHDKQKATYRWDRQKGIIIKAGFGPVSYDIQTPNQLRHFLLQQQNLSEILQLPIPRFAGVIVPASQRDLRTFPVNVFENNDDVSIYLTLQRDYPHFVAINIPSQGGAQLITQGTMLGAMQVLPKQLQNGEFDARLGTTKVSPPFGHDTLLLIAFKDQSWNKSNYFKTLLAKQKIDSLDSLLGYLRKLPKGAAKMAIIPFSTAP